MVRVAGSCMRAGSSDLGGLGVSAEIGISDIYSGLGTNIVGCVRGHAIISFLCYDEIMNCFRFWRRRVGTLLL
jgi:hypothetical protein